MKLGAKLKIVKSTFSMKITGRKVLKLMIKIKIQNHILNLHKWKMKTRMIFGVLFQALQFIILMSIGLIVLLSNISITTNMYVLIFGGIMLVGINVLSLVMIFTGMGNDAPVRKVKKEFSY